MYFNICHFYPSLSVSTYLWHFLSPSVPISQPIYRCLSLSISSNLWQYCFYLSLAILFLSVSVNFYLSLAFLSLSVPSSQHIYICNFYLYFCPSLAISSSLSISIFLYLSLIVSISLYGLISLSLSLSLSLSAVMAFSITIMITATISISGNSYLNLSLSLSLSTQVCLCSCWMCRHMIRKESCIGNSIYLCLCLNCASNGGTKVRHKIATVYLGLSMYAWLSFPAD